MAQNTTIFRELLRLLPIDTLKSYAREYNCDYYYKKFDTVQHLKVLLFAQIEGLDSLRSILTALGSQSNKWYHLGFNGISRSSLSEAMNKRNSDVFKGLFYALLDRVRKFTDKHSFKFDQEILSIDSTTIDLCLNLYPWAKFRQKKGAVKMHTLLNHDGYLPEFIKVTDGKVSDIKAVLEPGGIDEVLLPDSIVVFDRAYICYEWLHRLTRRKIFWVTRTKKNLDYKLTGQHKPINHEDILRDDIIELEGAKSKKDYPEKMRFIEYRDPKTGKHYEYITNIFDKDAKTVADIYKSRWQIELFFKCIKQNLKIKSFIGTSKNAVMSQIWVAMCYILLLKYIKYKGKFNGSISKLAWILRTVLMERLALIDVLRPNKQVYKKPEVNTGQLTLF